MAELALAPEAEEEDLNSEAPEEEEQSEGEHALLVALFERNMLDLWSSRPIIRTRAEEWFRSTDTTWIFSFESVCDILFSKIDPPVDPDAIRQKMLNREDVLMPSALLKKEKNSFIIEAEKIDFDELDDVDLPSELELEEAPE